MKSNNLKIGDIVTTHGEQFIETEHCQFRSDSFFKIIAISDDVCNMQFIPWIFSFCTTDTLYNVPIKFIKKAKKKDAKHHFYKQLNLPGKKVTKDKVDK